MASNFQTLDELDAARKRLEDERRRLRMESNGPHVAVPCPCGDSACRNWHVSPQADLQGVSFTKEEAEAVADLLNSRERAAA